MFKNSITLFLTHTVYLWITLSSILDECVTTKKWEPATTFACPDACGYYGPEFDGNVADPTNPYQYVACWKGITVGCVACPAGLKFNEQENACLYDGIYITKPLHKKKY